LAVKWVVDELVHGRGEVGGDGDVGGIDGDHGNIISLLLALLLVMLL
jgi:hypothetical protein